MLFCVSDETVLSLPYLCSELTPTQLGLILLVSVFDSILFIYYQNPCLADERAVITKTGSYEIWCPSETFAPVFSYLSMYRGNLRYDSTSKPLFKQ